MALAKGACSLGMAAFPHPVPILTLSPLLIHLMQFIVHNSDAGAVDILIQHIQRRSLETAAATLHGSFRAASPPAAGSCLLVCLHALSSLAAISACARQLMIARRLPDFLGAINRAAEAEAAAAAAGGGAAARLVPSNAAAARRSAAAGELLEMLRQQQDEAAAAVRQLQPEPISPRWSNWSNGGLPAAYRVCGNLPKTPYGSPMVATRPPSSQRAPQPGDAGDAQAAAAAAAGEASAAIGRRVAELETRIRAAALADPRSLAPGGSGLASSLLGSKLAAGAAAGAAGRNIAMVAGSVLGTAQECAPPPAAAVLGGAGLSGPAVTPYNSPKVGLECVAAAAATAGAGRRPGSAPAAAVHALGGAAGALAAAAATPYNSPLRALSGNKQGTLQQLLQQQAATFAAGGLALAAGTPTNSPARVSGGGGRYGGAKGIDGVAPLFVSQGGWSGSPVLVYGTSSASSSPGRYSSPGRSSSPGCYSPTQQWSPSRSSAAYRAVIDAPAATVHSATLNAILGASKGSIGGANSGTGTSGVSGAHIWGSAPDVQLHPTGGLSSVPVNICSVTSAGLRRYSGGGSCAVPGLASAALRKAAGIGGKRYDHGSALGYDGGYQGYQRSDARGGRHSLPGSECASLLAAWRQEVSAPQGQVIHMQRPMSAGGVLQAPHADSLVVPSLLSPFGGARLNGCAAAARPGAPCGHQEQQLQQLPPGSVAVCKCCNQPMSSCCSCRVAALIVGAGACGSSSAEAASPASGRPANCGGSALQEAGPSLRQWEVQHLKALAPSAGASASAHGSGSGHGAPTVAAAAMQQPQVVPVERENRAVDGLGDEGEGEVDGEQLGYHCMQQDDGALEGTHAQEADWEAAGQQGDGMSGGSSGMAGRSEGVRQVGRAAVAQGASGGDWRQGSGSSSRRAGLEMEAGRQTAQGTEGAEGTEGAADFVGGAANLQDLVARLQLEQIWQDGEDRQAGGLQAPPYEGMEEEEGVDRWERREEPLEDMNVGAAGEEQGEEEGKGEREEGIELYPTIFV